MGKDSPTRALLVVFLTALVCSSLVSAAVVLLRPIQLDNQLLERSRNIMQLTGLLAKGDDPEDVVILELYKSLDNRIVNIDQAAFEAAMDPNTFDMRRAGNDPDLSVEIPADLDEANLGRRSRYAPVYIVWKDAVPDRVILPLNGTGMWSTLYGFIALEGDLNTIAGMTFYEQNETPGLGDQITHAHWLAQWKGRRIYDDEWEPRFAVGEGVVAAGSAMADYEVDALTGATVTGNAVTGMMRYWFGPHGYQEFLAELRDRPPEKPAEGSG